MYVCIQFGLVLRKNDNKHTSDVMVLFESLWRLFKSGIKRIYEEEKKNKSVCSFSDRSRRLIKNENREQYATPKERQKENKLFGRAWVKWNRCRFVHRHTSDLWHTLKYSNQIMYRHDHQKHSDHHTHCSKCIILYIWFDTFSCSHTKSLRCYHFAGHCYKNNHNLQ